MQDEIVAKNVNRRNNGRRSMFEQRRFVTTCFNQAWNHRRQRRKEADQSDDIIDRWRQRSEVNIYDV